MDLKITSKELRQKYLDFFKSKDHAIIPSASLIPENDPTVLFTTAGMHPLVPYLMGEKHPKGKRLTNVQKCVRTGDIDEVGDEVHCTFFEMLGNWSIGDYFKKESITYSYEFLTEILKIEKEKLAITVFEGDEWATRDEESAKIWQEQGIAKDKIFYLPKKYNWWGPAGKTGPCGPDTEIFIDTGKASCSSACSPACDCGKYVEIWNNVFMEYEKLEDNTFIPLKQKNVDTGMGLERTVAMLNGFSSVYEIDVFSDCFNLFSQKELKEPDSEKVIKAKRIIADHIRTAIFMLGDQKGITPSNVDQGYVLRRLIRRAVRFCRAIELENDILLDIANIYIKNYSDYYSELKENADKIIKELDNEIVKFNKTLSHGLKEFEKVTSYIQNGVINGKAAFRLYDTFGFPVEITEELAKDKGMIVDIKGFHKAFEQHQKKSQQGAEQKFKGGLQDDSVMTTRLHTATHLLLSVLKEVLNDNSIEQRGSNITAERLRFDFNFERPLTDEEKQAVEDKINQMIKSKAEVVCEEMSVNEAEKQGATGIFKDKYLDIVKVYTIGPFSKEICGGPHVANIGELGVFKIKKEQSSSSGVRRIKAVLN